MPPRKKTACSGARALGWTPKLLPTHVAGHGCVEAPRRPGVVHASGRVIVSATRRARVRVAFTVNFETGTRVCRTSGRELAGAPHSVRAHARHGDGKSACGIDRQSPARRTHKGRTHRRPSCIGTAAVLLTRDACSHTATAAGIARPQVTAGRKRGRQHHRVVLAAARGRRRHNRGRRQHGPFIVVGHRWRMDGFFRLDKGRPAADSVQEDGDLPAGLCRNKLRQPARVVLPDNATRGAKQRDVHRAPTDLCTGCFPPYSGRRARHSGRQPVRTKHGPRKTGGRTPVTSGRRPHTGRRPPRTNHRPPCTQRRPPRPGCRRPRTSRRHPRGIAFDQAFAACTTTIRARADASRIGWRRDRRRPPRRTRPLLQHQAMAAARVDQTHAAQHLVKRVPCCEVSGSWVDALLYSRAV